MCTFKTSLCARSNCLRVYRHHAHMLKHICAFMPACTRDVSNEHTTPPQHHDNAHNHTQPQPKPRPTTRYHTVAENRVSGVKVQKLRVTTARRSEQHGSNHKPWAKNRGKTTKKHGHVLFFDGHGVTEGEPQTAHPHTTRPSHKPLATHSYTTHTTDHTTTQPRSHPNHTTPSHADEPSQAEPCHTTPHHAKSHHVKTGHAKNKPGNTKPGNQVEAISSTKRM